MSSFARTTA